MKTKPVHMLRKCSSVSYSPMPLRGDSRHGSTLTTPQPLTGDSRRGYSSDRAVYRS